MTIEIILYAINYIDNLLSKVSEKISNPVMFNPTSGTKVVLFLSVNELISSHILQGISLLSYAGTESNLC